MKLHRFPALMGTGCLALLMGAYVAGAQQTPNSVPSAASSPSGTGAGTPGAMQTGDMNNSAGSSTAGMADKHFVKEAMQGSMAEIQLGQLAQQNASSDDVKQFGQRMVQDHQKLSDQMQPIASQMGVTPPTELSAKDKALQKRLQGLTSAEFDKAYMSAMVQDHRKDLAEFKREASMAKDPQVKDAAQQGTQVISEHLHMAQDIAQKVGAGSGKGHAATEPNKPVGGSSGSTIGGGGNTAGHHNSVGSGEGSTTSNPK